MAKDDWNIDANIDNADWTKRTWDILPPTAQTLLETLGVARAPLAKKQQEIAKFMKLPAARAMPPELKAELKKMGLLQEVSKGRTGGPI